MEILDGILRMFIAAMQAGAANLGVYTVSILGTFALIAWYWDFGQTMMLGGNYLQDALAGALLKVLQLGVYYWLATNIGAMAEALIATATLWGIQVGGASATGILLTPSGIVAIGWKVVAPLDAFIKAHAGVTGLFSGNFPLLIGYALGVGITILAFYVVAGAIMAVQIEFYLAAMTGALFLPFAVLGATAFLAEWCISWLVGTAIRVFLSCAVIGLGFELFAQWNLPTGPGGSPTMVGGMTLLAVAWLYVGLAVLIPRQAANMCGRVSLGLTGSQLLSAPMGSGRVTYGVTQAAHAVRAIRGG